ncbi:Periplasmic hemin-binding protein [plant metagenome]|uniref:Periplasmic hemin-binding protein n=1 Tax=plant metagenome TaxID=1297885 RepID=A0A484QSQ5_9ZZZZ
MLKTLLSFLLLAVAHTSLAAPARVVSLGGGITEIVYALGAGDTLVGNDLSSLYPAEATRLPRVGYYRDVSVEGVASLRPDLVLASDQAGPPDALDKLRALGIPVQIVPDAPTLASLQARIEQVGAALERKPQAEALFAGIRRDLDALGAPPKDNAPRALSLMARGGTPLGAGQGTAANAMLELAGLRNVLAGQQGYKPVTAEALAATAPQVIITTHMTEQAQGGMAKLLAQPGIASTPAARDKRVVVMDDLLYLSFGPRLPQAVAELRRAVAQ